MGRRRRDKGVLGANDIEHLTNEAIADLARQRYNGPLEEQLAMHDAERQRLLRNLTPPPLTGAQQALYNGGYSDGTTVNNYFYHDVSNIAQPMAPPKPVQVPEGELTELGRLERDVERVCGWGREAMAA